MILTDRRSRNVGRHDTASAAASGATGRKTRFRRPLRNVQGRSSPLRHD